MATINCPFRHCWISKRGNVQFEFYDVDIHNDICSNSDRCEQTDCRYHDTSKEADQRYWEGILFTRTLEGLGYDEHYKKKLLAQDPHRQKPPERLR